MAGERGKRGASVAEMKKDGRGDWQASAHVMNRDGLGCDTVLEEQKCKKSRPVLEHVTDSVPSCQLNSSRSTQKTVSAGARAK